MLITELTELDPAIKKVLPHGSTVLAIAKHGHSLWTSTFKVETRGPHGELIDYFLKCSLGERGRLMMEGEFEGSKAIHAVSPDFCPAPVAAGKFTGLEDAYFYICEFVEMTSISPPVAESTFCEQLAALHKNGKSPNGKFGFHVTTCNGWIPQLNDWEASWTTFFRKGFVHLLDLDRKTNSPAVTGMFDDYLDKFLDVVIPRLLLPLETEGNSIDPSLIHGDLWCGNADTSAGKNQPMIFDGATFYAHNEYELGNWRPKRNKFTAAHMRKYQLHFPISQPTEEFEDRHILYSMRFNFHATILFPASSLYRQFVLEDMAYLVDKYGEETLE